MSAIFVWIVSIGLGTAALTVTAALKLYYLHMAVAAAVAVFMALAAIGEVRAAASDEDRAQVSLRHLGLVWIWTALNLFVTYAFGFTWRPWLPLFSGCFLAGGLCLFLASTLRQAVEENQPDPLFSRMARLIAMFSSSSPVAPSCRFASKCSSSSRRFCSARAGPRGTSSFSARSHSPPSASARCAWKRQSRNRTPMDPCRHDKIRAITGC